MRATIFQTLQRSSHKYNAGAGSRNTSLISGLVHSLGGERLTFTTLQKNLIISLILFPILCYFCFVSILIGTVIIIIGFSLLLLSTDVIEKKFNLSLDTGILFHIIGFSYILISITSIFPIYVSDPIIFASILYIIGILLHLIVFFTK
jgi:hypothetical protein